MSATTALFPYLGVLTLATPLPGFPQMLGPGLVMWAYEGDASVGRPVGPWAISQCTQAAHQPASQPASPPECLLPIETTGPETTGPKVGRTCLLFRTI